MEKPNLTEEQLKEARRIFTSEAGQANLKKRGKKFYSKIGRKGGKAKRKTLNK